MTGERRDRSLFVVFGARGDLSRRKLLPAFFRLIQRRCWSEDVVVLGVGTKRQPDDAAFRTMARTALREAGVPDAQLGIWCDQCFYYHSTGNGTPEEFAGLARRIEEIEAAHGLPGNRVFYLALPPAAFGPTVRGLGGAGLHRGPGWTRLVVEKPFGRDRASAEALNRTVHEHFSEEQVYRIDHYLGKETVQNLLVFRFGNAIFESLWNRDRVDHVQITVAEAGGLQGRGGYYEQAGALRDMVQNHLTQVLLLVGMEIPPVFESDAVRTEKVKVLRSLAPLRVGDVVYGQYVAGRQPEARQPAAPAVGAREAASGVEASAAGEGERMPGYREEPDVAPDSSVETFVALKLEIANWRWTGVPFYLRTGKRLPRGVSQIVVQFRRPPVSIFRSVTGGPNEPDVLAITIQPDEGFDLGFDVKIPGQGIRLSREFLRFRYADRFPRVPEAYETLLEDILQGDQTLFVRADVVEESWRLYAPLLEAPPAAEPYAAGTWGPAGADALLARDGRRWMVI